MIVTRDEAKAQGLSRYKTGKPCKRGHISERLVINHRCVECQVLQDSAWRKAHRAECSEQKRKWVEDNRERERARKKSYYRDNPKDREAQAKRGKRWLEANREKSRAATARWRKDNLATAAAAMARRKAKILQRTPVWADHDKIRQFYLQARELTERTGIEHEVDHIYPLQGKLVSGLHVETNMRVITKGDNRSKGARLIHLS